MYKVEGWPCDTKIPNLPTAANQNPGAAVLGTVNNVNEIVIPNYNGVGLKRPAICRANNSALP
jgi:hypothetical protein